jgi:hypothetical protein
VPSLRKSGKAGQKFNEKFFPEDVSGGLPARSSK